MLKAQPSFGDRYADV